MKLFVAAMGASNYTYAEACPREGLADWIRVHLNLFAFLGGVPTFVVCENLKAAVTNADRHDPGPNRTYAEMASHYGTAIIAARPRRPKDKAKIEVAVQVAQRWLLARVRNQRFFFVGGAERRHQNTGRRTQCAADARLWRQPRRTVLRTRQAQNHKAAGSGLRFRALEAMPGRPRLSYRDRWILVLHAITAHP